MAKADKSSGLQKLFEDQVADLYYAEKKLVTALKKMAGKANDQKLSAAFLSHREETQGHVDRLEKVFGLLDKKAKGKKCDAMDGLVKEAEGIMDEFKDDPALDAALICAAQKVEHYEIGSYGSLATYAEELGYKEAAKLLHTTLKEEKAADEKLTKLAEGSLNMAGEAHRNHGKGSDATGTKSGQGAKVGKTSSAGKASHGSGKNGQGAKKPTSINKTKQSKTPSTTG